MKGRIISIIMVMLILFSLNIVPSRAADHEPEPYIVLFKDLNDHHWGFYFAYLAYEKGFIQGYADGTFRPDNQVTYGEFIKMAIVAITKKHLDIGLPGSHWATNYYEKALELKLFTPEQIPITNLDKSIPRKDMAIIAANGTKGEVSDKDATIIENFIPDIDKAGDRKEYIIKAYYLGILSGYPDKTFRPDRVLTRIESTEVIINMTDHSGKSPLDLVTMGGTVPVYPDGRTVPRDQLLPTIRSIDPDSLDETGSSNEFLKYISGGIYNMQSGSSFYLQISYVDTQLVSGSFPNIGRQKARIKFLLQHFLQEDWETCYNRFLAMEKNTSARKDISIEIKTYNGKEVIISGSPKGLGISIYKPL